ncbi:DUF1573 domain-containing protein [Candidatus Microgenomates bacterium]|nr:DUF1573 domain-containing protein [Candidatus Microgenomates bacterium]
MSTKVFIIGAVVFIAVIVGLSFLLTSGQKPPPATANYAATDTQRPIIETPETSVDFGEMKVADTKQKDFELKNTGTKPLSILNVNSSCNCTFAQVIYNGTESKEFGMHAQSGYVTDIAPGTSAMIRVIYRPAIMPVYGPVERQVFIKTNDPEKENLTFSLNANVK